MRQVFGSFLASSEVFPCCRWSEAAQPSETVGYRELQLTEQPQPQAEATTLLHESPDSKPETIEQRKIVFHHIRVWVAGMWVVPLVRAKPRGESREKCVSIKRRTSCSTVQIKWHIKDTFYNSASKKEDVNV